MKQILSLTFLLLVGTAHAADYSVLQRYSGILEGRDFQQFINVQDLSGYRRRTIDLSKIEAELDVKINPISKFELEVEFEHGGTGIAMEYDTDEFGEFENEVEKGGEVVIEEAYYLRHLTPTTDVLLGKAPVFFSFSSIQRHPLMYNGTRPMTLEARMIPQEWAELGAQLHQRLGDFTLRAGYIAGLNSEFFRTYDWVAGGHQRHFEHVNFDDPAYTGSVEWGDVANGRGFAVSYYTTNTTKNRHKKNRLTKDNNIYIWSALGAWQFGRVGIKAEWINGEMSNADEVTTRNHITAISPGDFDQLGSRAVLTSAQMDYEFIDGWTAFGRWEHVNTFADVTGIIYQDPRYDVRQLGWGITHKWDEVCALKFEYYREWNKLPGMPVLGTYVAQFVFDTGSF